MLYALRSPCSALKAKENRHFRRRRCPTRFGCISLEGMRYRPKRMASTTCFNECHFFKDLSPVPDAQLDRFCLSVCASSSRASSQCVGSSHGPSAQVECFRPHHSCLAELWPIPRPQPLPPLELGLLHQDFHYGDTLCFTVWDKDFGKTDDAPAAQKSAPALDMPSVISVLNL